MYNANLPHKLLKKYLRKATKAKLLNKTKHDFYIITNKGQSFLEKYRGYNRSKEPLKKKIDMGLNLEKELLEMCTPDSN
jgi:predicted transcriptional regulator